jgi:hypothetical protein
MVAGTTATGTLEDSQALSGGELAAAAAAITGGFVTASARTVLASNCCVFLGLSVSEPGPRCDDDNNADDDDDDAEFERLCTKATRRAETDVWLALTGSDAWLALGDESCAVAIAR